MRGRLRVAFERLLFKHGLNYDRTAAAGVDVSTLLMALAYKLPEGEDKEECLALAAKAGSLCSSNPTNDSNVHFKELQEEGVGAEEAEYLFNQYGYNAVHRVLEDTDFLTEIEELRLREKKEKRRNAIIIIALIAVLIGGIAIYNLPYFAEKRMYSEVEKVFEDKETYRYEGIVREYMLEYPDGKHKEEVLMFPIKAYWADKDAIKTLDAVSLYLNECPNGNNIAEVKEIYDKVWDAEIAKYDQKAASKATQDGADFVREMLQYMRDNNVRKVSVSSDAVLNLKEYDEYPAGLRSLMESDYTGERFTPKNSMHTIKDKINENETKSWTQYITRSLQDGFDNVLTPGLIEFVSEEDSGDEKNPNVKVTYKVQTQETTINGNLRIPDIWVYTQKNSHGLILDGGLYLGIMLDFVGDFNIPGKDIGLKVTAKGNPGDASFSDVDPDDMYKRMCERCAKTFAEKIESELGVEKQ